MNDNYLKCQMRGTYFSSNEYIFFRAASQGSLASSTKDVTCFSNFIRSWYSKAASRRASAFPSGQSKCLRTARSSTYKHQHDIFNWDSMFDSNDEIDMIL